MEIKNLHRILNSRQVKALAALIETKNGFSNQTLKRKLQLDEISWSRYMQETSVKPTETRQGQFKTIKC